ncbi:MAG: hypothetical protein EBV59_04615 [Synechococcaceae bacterium WB7_1C_051]|nr:hypothetical protein [Synechococcaceae bacterium WB7_1C_051]
MNPLPSINGGPDQTVCQGASATLTATGGSSYSWNNGVSNGVPFVPNATTTYTVTGTNANGCTNTDQVNVTVAPIPTLTGNTVLCPNTTSQLTANANPNANTPWVSSNVAVATVSNSGFVTAIGFGTSTITFTNNNGCSTTTTINVTNPVAPTFNPIAAVCSGAALTLPAASTNNVQGTWSPAVNNTQTTTYTFTPSAGQCATTAQLTVTVNPNPTLSGGGNVCVGSTLQLTGSGSPSANTPWSSATPAVGTVSNNGLFTALTPGSSVVTYTNANGCSASTPITALGPVNGATQQVTACLTYAWHGQTLTQSGTYTDTLQTVVGCDSIVTLNLTISDSIVGPTTQQSACGTYTWNGQTYTQSGTYTYHGTTQNGCDSTATLVLTINQAPGNPQVTLNQGTFSVSAQNATTYAWMDCATNTLIPGANASNYTPAVSGSYAAIVSNTCGSDTSTCEPIEVQSVLELNNGGMVVYPNPSSGIFTLSTTGAMIQKLATTCPNATVILQNQLPIVNQPLVCGGTDDITTASVAASILAGGCNNTLYFTGWEALYTFTPSVSGMYQIDISGQTYTSIFVTNGCPTTPGSTCVGGVASAAAAKSLVVTLSAGTTYYIWFDTWPTPQSPCPGTFSMTQLVANVATATATGGLWSSPATWVSGVVPNAASSVIIPAGSIVTVDQVTNLVDLSVSGTLQWNATSNAMTLTGNVLINPGGRFLPYLSTGLTGVTINVGGNFTNNGYANFAAGTTTSGLLNFNGSQQLASLNQVLDGSGVFEGTANAGIIRQLFFQTTGSSTINTAQNLITYSFGHTAGSLNTNGKLTINNVAKNHGTSLNTQVSNVVVTNMGSLYNASPVVFGTAVTPWTASSGAILNSRYFSGGNVYLCTAAGTFGAVAPSGTAAATQVNGTATLLYIGALGTLGNPFQVTAVTVGTQYFYGGNLYTCTVAGTPSAAAPPVHVSGTAASGTATFLYVGSPAQVAVNYDGTTQTVRSLTLVNNGSGYSSATAPTLSFSLGVVGGTGSGAAATSVILYAIWGPTNSLAQKSGQASITGGLTINSDQGASTLSVDPQASSGVGMVYTTNGGVNYTVAPTVGFAGPTALNLVTNPGSGYAAAPTITVTGGTLVSGAALTTANFTITVNQGKVVSVYLNAGTSACYSVPPTLAFSTGTATLAFPAGCWPAATAVIGANRQITSFTITNPGFGYVVAPIVGVGLTSGTAAGGTFTTVATVPVSRVALYNLTLNYFSPATAAVQQADNDIIPSNRKLNNLSLAGNGLGLSINSNLTIYGTAPLTLTASGSVPGNILNLNGNSLICTWNGYAGATSTFGATNVYLQGGSMVIYGRGGGTTGSTWNFPFSGTFTAATGTGLGFVDGSDITKMTVTETAAPNNALVGGNAIAVGNRAFRVQTNSFQNTPGISGNNPTVTLRYNSQDNLTNTQDQTFVARAGGLSGQWNVVSNAYGLSGALPATGLITTPTVAPGPISLVGNDYFAWASTAPTVSNVAPLALCSNSGTFTITGTNLNGVSAVTIGGTAVASFVIVSNTTITGVAGAGTSGVIAVVKNGQTFSGAQFITINNSPNAPVASPASATVLLGGITNFTATGAGGTYNWYTVPFGGASISSGSSFTTPANCSSGSYYVSEFDGTCEGPRFQVTVNVTPITIASSVPNFCGVGGNITLTASPNDPSITYTWSSNVPSATIAPGTSAITTASITETSDFFISASANGCTANAQPISIGVYTFPAITPTATPNTICGAGNSLLQTNLNASNFQAICITPSPIVVPGNANALVTNGVAMVPLTSGSLDDGGWGAIPIGFSFNYFGSTYNTINVGTNGVLQFGAYNGSGTGGLQDFTIGALPNNLDPMNAIFGSAGDLHCGYAGASLTYWTAGVAPNRKFIVNYQVFQYAATTTPVNFQVILYETTGRVDIVAINVMATNAKTIGVNNPTGTVGAAAPNCATNPNTPNYWQAQTATIPAVSPQAWRFIPPVNYTFNWSVNGVGNPANAQLNGVTVNTSSTTQFTAATTNYQVYILDPITNCSQVFQTPVTVLPLPSSPSAINSNQCGLGVPTASVSSTAGASGSGQYYWFDASVNGNLIQTPPVGAFATFYSENFSGPAIAPGASLSGSANLINYPGQLQLFNNQLTQQGGITVNAGVNASSYMVDFDLITSTGADGLSYSFGDDVNALATTPSQEMGSGSKLKIGFDAYGVMPNGQGIYLMYNCQLASFNATSPGVIAYSSDNSWVNDTSHISISIDNYGKLTLTVGATTIFNGVQLPAAYLASDKSTWKHAIAGRTGGISMLATIDNLLIQYANNTAGTNTYQTAINTTSTYYVTEQGTNGCFSIPSPVTINVLSPAAIVTTPVASATLCLGQSVNLDGISNASPPYTFSWDANTYNGSGLNNPISGAQQTITPYAGGNYVYTITGTNGVCTATASVNVTVNNLPVLTSTVATPAAVCNNGTVALVASSFISGPQTLPVGYCAVSNFGGTGTFIDNFSFNTINNNTAATNPVAFPYYTNYPITTTVNIGQTYPLSVTISAPGVYAGAIVSVWIDYNRDGVYAPSEWQQVGVNILGGNTATINVTIPANALPGLTSLRLRSRGAGNPNSASNGCTAMGSGETEDYQVNIQAAPANPYTYTWNTAPAINSASGTTVASNNTGSNITVNYIVTALDPITGCTNTDTTNNVTVYPAILPPTTVGSSHCGIQVPTATANDVNGFVGPNYNWYATPVSANALQSNGTNSYAGLIGNSTTLYVSVTDTLTGCETSSTPVTVTVTPGPVLTLANTNTTICVGNSSSPIGLTAGAANYNTFTWSPAAGVTGNATTGWVFNPAVSTVYTLTATQTSAPNCSNQDTLNLNVDQIIPPAPTVPQNLVNACSGSNSILIGANAPTVNNTFTYTLNFFDSFGDGWNNNTINVNVNGVPVLNGVTLANGFTGSLTFTVNGGDAITTQFNAIGLFVNECSYNLVDNNGNVIFSGTPASAVGPPNLINPYIVPTIPTPNYVINWYNASANGTYVGTGSPFQTVGTSVLPVANNGTYMFYAGTSLGACNSLTTVPVTVNVADVSATITAINATCNSVANGSFTATNFTCGTAPYTYSVDNGAFGSIPTNLAAGTHTVVIRDALNLLSSLYTIVITQPAWTVNAPTVGPNAVICATAPSALLNAAATLNGINTVVVDTFVIASGVYYPNGGVQTFTQNIQLPANAVVTNTQLSVENVTTSNVGWPSDYLISMSGASTLGNQTLANVFAEVTNAGPYTFSPSGIVAPGGNVTLTLNNTYGPGIGYFGNIYLFVTYTVPANASGITWWNASSAGNQVANGTTIQSVGTTVLPNTLTPGVYNFYAQGEGNGCSSLSRTLVTVTVNALPNVNAGNNQALTKCICRK